MCDGYVDAARVKSILREKSFPPGKILDRAITSILEVEEKFSYKRVAKTGLSTRKAFLRTQSQILQAPG